MCEKISLGSFKNVICEMCIKIIYLIYMYKKDLQLINLQWLIYNKTQPKQTKCIIPLGIK